MSTVGDRPPLPETLAALRAALVDTSYPLALPGAVAAEAARAALLGQLDDYLVPRLARLDAPLLAVVGGSTGAGKSTLVNTLAEAPVTAAGVLRPTTRAPVLVSHPSDAPWFRRPHLLPGLERTSNATPTEGSLQLVSAHALIPGLALLDTPDIDSVVEGNRELAGQLLAAADLWLFVTTAARYADAVPWALLDTARARGAAIALVLNRVPPKAVDEVGAHFAELLVAHGLGDEPLFVVPETIVDGQGLLPERAIAPLRRWLTELARDAGAREAVIRRTAIGALASATVVTRGLAAAAEEQVAAAQDLTERVRLAHRAAFSAVREGLADGTPLRGEVLARWQEFVRSGELFTVVRARLGGLGSQIVTTVTGRRAPGGKLKASLRSGVATLVEWAATRADEQLAEQWRAHPAGAALLAAAGAAAPAGPARPGDAAPGTQDLAWRCELLVRNWQRAVSRLVRAQLFGKRTGGRATSYAANAVGLLVMIRVCSAEAVIPPGLEVAAAGRAGATVSAKDLLESVFGDPVVEDLATRAREDLLARARALLDEEEQRYLDLVAAAGLREETAARLRRCAELLDRAATAAVEPRPEPGDAAGTAADPDATGAPAPGVETGPEAAAEAAAEAAEEPEPERAPVSVPKQRTRRKLRRRAR